jgi:hypothetical protein
MQIPGRVHLGPQHRVDPLRRQRRHHRVIEHTRGMNNRRQRMLHRNVRDHLGQRRTIRGVAGDHRYLGPGSRELRGQLRSTGRIGAASADQQQMPRIMIGHHVAGQRRTHHAGTAGDHHGALRPGIRHRQHDLAGMTSLTQIPQRRGCTPHVERCDRQRPQHAGVKELGQVQHVLVHAVAAGLEEVEGAVAHTGIVLGDLSRVADVGFTHLEEDPARRDQSQGGVDELTGQRVQYDVHAPVADDRAELVFKLQRARIADVIVVKAHRPQRVPLAPAGGGKYLQPEVPRQLHCGHSHATGTGVHQHPLARFDVGEVNEGEVGRGENG